MMRLVLVGTQTCDCEPPPGQKPNELAIQRTLPVRLNFRRLQTFSRLFARALDETEACKFDEAS